MRSGQEFDYRDIENRFANEAAELREQERALERGYFRTTVSRRARQAETGSHIGGWARSPGLRAPK